ncbi:MAG: 50S ribosomal protein L29 [Chloroflexia bacterium]
MKRTNLSDLTLAELQQKLEEARRELFDLRFRLAIGRLPNYSRIPQVRREIARILTEQRRRQLQESGLQEAKR